MIVLALLCSGSAFVLLGLATDRHHRRHLGSWYSVRRAAILRATAWMLLVATMTLTTSVWGTVVGPVAGVGAIIMGAAFGFVALNMVRRTTTTNG